MNSKHYISLLSEGISKLRVDLADRFEAVFHTVYEIGDAVNHEEIDYFQRTIEEMEEDVKKLMQAARDAAAAVTKFKADADDLLHTITSGQMPKHPRTSEPAANAKAPHPN